MIFKEIIGARRKCAEVRLSASESTIAKMKLEMGPASEITAASRLGFFKLKGSKLTGFPQPKPKKSRNSSPMPSIWTNGFSFSLPASLGVGSPK